MNDQSNHVGVKVGKTKILLVDDHTILREGLTMLINEEPDLVVCAEAQNAAQAQQVLKDHSVDLVILDITLGGTSGIQLTKKLKAKYPDLLILILTMHDEALYARRALRARADGYITKHEAPETIITAIHQVLEGQQYISQRMAAKIKDAESFQPKQRGQQ